MLFLFKFVENATEFDHLTTERTDSTWFIYVGVGIVVVILLIAVFVIVFLITRKKRGKAIICQKTFETFRIDSMLVNLVYNHIIKVLNYLHLSKIKHIYA